MNFYGLASGINLVWPYLAIGYLMRHRGRERAGRCESGRRARDRRSRRRYNSARSRFGRRVLSPGPHELLPPPHLLLPQSARRRAPVSCADRDAAKMQEHAKKRCKQLGLTRSRAGARQQGRLPRSLRGRAGRGRLSGRRLVHVRRPGRHRRDRRRRICATARSSSGCCSMPAPPTVPDASPRHLVARRRRCRRTAGDGRQPAPRSCAPCTAPTALS